MKFLLTIVIAFCLCSSSYSQSGCTDPQALNFDAQATDNDGSCIYGLTTYNTTEVADLDAQLNECSGIEVFDNRLWALNDGGNPNAVYIVDTTDGSVLQTINVLGTSNKDWEELAEDADHLYIGDFGNNAGDRMDLSIYKVLKSDLLAGTVEVDTILFSFSDQTVFTHTVNDHNYDCEAFFHWGDSLHLFSKNWEDGQTRHYVLPTTPGQYQAEVKDSFNVDGLITGADIDDEGTVVLLGYKGVVNFMWVLFDYDGHQFFSGNKRRITLGTVLSNGQTEGITFSQTGIGYIGSERIENTGIVIPPKLFSFETRQWTNRIVSTTSIEFDNMIDISPNPVDDFFKISFEREVPNDLWIRLVDVAGKPVDRFLKKSITNRAVIFEQVNLYPGIYFLEIRTTDGSISRKIVKK